MALNDGSCLNSLQIVIDADIFDYDTIVAQINTGAAIEVSGTLKESPGKGQRVELQATTVKLIGAVGADYPLQKKRQSPNFQRNRSSSLQNTSNGCPPHESARPVPKPFTAFKSHGFFYVHTPIITASDTEGAGEMFQVTTLI